MRLTHLVAAVVAILAASACQLSQSAVEAVPDPDGPPVLVGAGDIATCGGEGDEATAELVAEIPGTVFVLGDAVYENGSIDEYNSCYEASWGRFRERTRPAPGNHDYKTRNAGGYFTYFGELAGARGDGWYSYELGGWHIVVLNSNCSRVDDCRADSEQLEWLKDDLAASDAECTLAYWHHSRFSSGAEHGSQRQVGAFWEVLYEAGAEAVISAHDHIYERFGRQDPSGAADNLGIRQFTVGTGGKGGQGADEPIANSEVLIEGEPGVLKVELGDGELHWDFISVENGSMDSGQEACH